MEDQLPYLGPRSLSSMAMERILLLDISTPSSSIPATLLEDIIILRTCEGTYRMSSSSARQHNLTTQTTQPLPLPHIISSRNISVTKPDPGTWQKDCLMKRELLLWHWEGTQGMIRSMSAVLMAHPSRLLRLFWMRTLMMTQRTLRTQMMTLLFWNGNLN